MKPDREAVAHEWRCAVKGCQMPGSVIVHCMWSTKIPVCDDHVKPAFALRDKVSNAAMALDSQFVVAVMSLPTVGVEAKEPE